MKLKLDENGNVVVNDGKPVYVQDDGKEIVFDAPGTLQTITRLNGEAKSHRERAETAETSLKTFEGIADPVAALAALDTVKNLADKTLVDAGEVEKVRTEAGGYGSLLTPYQAFVIARRPEISGLPYIAGYDTSLSGYGTPSHGQYISLERFRGEVTDAQIYAAVAAVKIEGSIVWVRLE